MTTPIPTFCQDFENYMHMGFCAELPEHEKNCLEIAGDALYSVVSFPFKAFRCFEDPRVVTIALAALALFTAALMLYPAGTAATLVQAFQAFAHLPWCVIRDVAFGFVALGITAIATRAIGIFTNDQAIEAYYTKYPKAPETPEVIKPQEKATQPPEPEPEPVAD